MLSHVMLTQLGWGQGLSPSDLISQMTYMLLSSDIPKLSEYFGFKVSLAFIKCIHASLVSLVFTQSTWVLTHSLTICGLKAWSLPEFNATLYWEFVEVLNDPSILSVHIATFNLHLKFKILFHKSYHMNHDFFWISKQWHSLCSLHVASNANV